MNPDSSIIFEVFSSKFSLDTLLKVLTFLLALLGFLWGISRYVFPTDTFYLSLYKIYAKTSGGICSAIYNPAKIKGLKNRYKAEIK